MKIVADSHIPFIKEYFGQFGELLLKSGRDINHHDVVDADILLVRSITHVDKALLTNTNVKYVGSVTAGADHIDMHFLEEAGIGLCLASGFNAPPVADYVVGVIAALQKQERLLQSGLRAAVVGVGSVGKLVEARLNTLNISTLLCDPLRAENETSFQSTPLHELTDLDVITLHVPLTRKGRYPTYHFIDKTFLQRQKPGCVLINASRGSVINSQELLQYGKHLHWCFDVWEHEPVINKSVLANVFIATPHIAGYSVQSKIRGIDMIYKKARALKWIPEIAVSPISMPHQTSDFSRKLTCWQDAVLSVFNPLEMTESMRDNLLPDDANARLFDEMRNQFNHRYEFSCTTLKSLVMTAVDQQLLKALGFTLV